LKVASFRYLMKKFLILLLTIIISIALAGLFGILHDQITYSISHEYYTKFKFHQFGLTNKETEAIFPNPRIAVSKVGFMATWWVGKWIGIILGLTGLIFIDHKKMFNAIFNALLITFITTMLFSFAGFLYGKYQLAITGVDWWLPDNLIDRKNFIIVGSIHNFSYLGGASGLAIGAIYLMRKNKIQRTKLKQASS
jgi:hypothetical protein